MLSTLERNKGFTVLLLAAAIVLLILVTAGLDSRLLEFTTPAADISAAKSAAVDRYPQLFAHDYFTNFVAAESDRDVFATTYFNKPKPTPVPKPGTREVPVDFMGAIENSRGEVTAFLRVDAQLRKLTAGDVVISDWKVASVTGDLLTLTNSAPQTNSVEFKKSLKITIPIN